VDQERYEDKRVTQRIGKGEGKDGVELENEKGRMV
jgi:hypothetical protein